MNGVPPRLVIVSVFLIVPYAYEPLASFPTRNNGAHHMAWPSRSGYPKASSLPLTTTTAADYKRGQMPSARDPATTSRIMASVRSRDTKPEKALRRALHFAGLRFLVCPKGVPGRPDVYFPSRGVAVFVDGDYWHGNSWRARGFTSLVEQFSKWANPEFWLQKISGNIARDRRVDADLRAAGIQPLRLWESEVLADLPGCVRRVVAALDHADGRGERLTSIEMFTGAGGLALGLAEAGFDHLAIIEWDKHACASIRGNQRGMPRVAFWPLYEMDVRRFDFKPYADKTSLLAAGVPCQPFSLGGKHAGNRDDRNMFPEVMRAVRDLRPKMVLVENVKGLLRQGFRPYFEYILLQLEMPDIAPGEGEAWEAHKARLLRERAGRDGLRYDTSAQLINCADYGAPQVRQRVFVAAVRRDLGVRWSPLTPTHSADALLYAQWVDGSYWREHKLPVPKTTPPELRDRVRALGAEGRPATKRWRTVRDALRGLPVPAHGQEDLEFTNHVGNPGARSYPGHTGSPYDWPAKTLKAGVHGVPGGENMLRYPNGQVRYFTAREAARVQTFPDEYRFSGAWGECMRQVGNAVPVIVAKIIATAARTLLDSVTSGAGTTGPTEPPESQDGQC